MGTTNAVGEHSSGSFCGPTDPRSPLCSTPQTCPRQLGAIELLTGDLPQIFVVQNTRNGLLSTPTNSVAGKLSSAPNVRAFMQEESLRFLVFVHFIH